MELVSKQTNLNLTTLHSFSSGDKGKVVEFQAGTESYRHKLLVMGLTPGTEFIFVRKAPLGDPVEIQVRGYTLSLRKTEARALLVEKLGQ